MVKKEMRVVEEVREELGAIGQHEDLSKALELYQDAWDANEGGDEKKWAMKMQAFYFYKKRGSQHIALSQLQEATKDASQQIKDAVGKLVGLLEVSRVGGGGKSVIAQYTSGTDHGRIPLYFLMYKVTEGGGLIPQGTGKSKITEGLLAGNITQRWNLKQVEEKVREEGEKYKIEDGMLVW